MHGDSNLVDTFSHADFLKYLWGFFTFGFLMLVFVRMDLSYTFQLAIVIGLVSMFVL